VARAAGRDIIRWRSGLFGTAMSLPHLEERTVSTELAGEDWGPRSNRGKSNGYGSDLHEWALGPPSHDLFLKEFPQVSSNTVGFCSIATGTPNEVRSPHLAPSEHHNH
jgi:hypothetical protein